MKKDFFHWISGTMTTLTRRDEDGNLNLKESRPPSMATDRLDRWYTPAEAEELAQRHENFARLIRQVMRDEPKVQVYLKCDACGHRF